MSLFQELKKVFFYLNFSVALRELDGMKVSWIMTLWFIISKNIFVLPFFSIKMSLETFLTWSNVSDAQFVEMHSTAH